MWVEPTVDRKAAKWAVAWAGMLAKNSADLKAAARVALMVGLMDEVRAVHLVDAMAELTVGSWGEC